MSLRSSLLLFSRFSFNDISPSCHSHTETLPLSSSPPSILPLPIPLSPSFAASPSTFSLYSFLLPFPRLSISQFHLCIAHHLPFSRFLSLATLIRCSSLFSLTLISFTHRDLCHFHFYSSLYAPSLICLLLLLLLILLSCFLIVLVSPLFLHFLGSLLSSSSSSSPSPSPSPFFFSVFFLFSSVSSPSSSSFSSPVSFVFSSCPLHLLFSPPPSFSLPPLFLLPPPPFLLFLLIPYLLPAFLLFFVPFSSPGSSFFSDSSCSSPSSFPSSSFRFIFFKCAALYPLLPSLCITAHCLFLFCLLCPSSPSSFHFKSEYLSSFLVFLILSFVPLLMDQRREFVFVSSLFEIQEARFALTKAK